MIREIPVDRIAAYLIDRMDRALMQLKLPGLPESEADVLRGEIQLIESMFDEFAIDPVNAVLRQARDQGHLPGFAHRERG